MPLVRISLREGKPEEYKKALADGVHRALVEAIEIPAAGSFSSYHRIFFRRPDLRSFVSGSHQERRNCAGANHAFYRSQTTAEAQALTSE